MTAWTTCIRCGLSGYDIAPRRGRGYSRYCRYCLASPDFEPMRKEARRASGREHMRRVRARRKAERWQAIEGRVVLGPVRCRHCGRMVFWDGWFWNLASRGVTHSRRKSVDKSSSQTVDLGRMVTALQTETPPVREAFQ